MISELFFAENYNFFWNDLLPGRSDYVRNQVNKYKKGKNETLKRPFPLIQVEEAPERRDIINEISFSLFRDYCQSKPVKVDEIDFKIRFKQEITETELKVIAELLKRLTDIFAQQEELKVSPVFSGCGLVDESRGDIYYKDTLVEIKARGYREYKMAGDLFKFLKAQKISRDTIDRLKNLDKKLYRTNPDKKSNKTKNELANDLIILGIPPSLRETIFEYFDYEKGCNFEGTDLQQLLIYGALNYIQVEKREIKRFRLFNPRLGFLWEADVEEVAENLGGCSSTDIYNEIIHFISNDQRSL